MGNVLIFDWMCEDEVYAHVEVNFDTEDVKCEEYCDELALQFMGKLPHTIESVATALELRCIPKERPDVDEVLGWMGINGYNPFEIVKVTHGYVPSDNLWIRFEGEDLKWEDVKLVK